MLPRGFGEFEIEALDNSTHGDSICVLVGYDNWHSHEDPLQLVLDVFSGKCLLIEQYSDGGIAPRKYVTYDFVEFLEALPRGATYKVYNATQEELERRSQPPVQRATMDEFPDAASNSSHPVGCRRDVDSDVTGLTVPNRSASMHSVRELGDSLGKIARAHVDTRER